MEDIKKVKLLDEIARLKHELQTTKDWLQYAESIIECYIKETNDKNDLGAQYFVDKISSY